MNRRRQFDWRVHIVMEGRPVRNVNKRNRKDDDVSLSLIRSFQKLNFLISLRIQAIVRWRRQNSVKTVYHNGKCHQSTRIGISGVSSKKALTIRENVKSAEKKEEREKQGGEGKGEESG